MDWGFGGFFLGYGAPIYHPLRLFTPPFYKSHQMAFDFPIV
jgi:hypothetical protein